MTAPIGCLDGEQAIRDALAAGPTPGPWDVDSTKNDGEYGDGGPDSRSGFSSFVLIDPNGRAICDTVNSDVAEVEEWIDDDDAGATDVRGQKNAAYIAACNPETMRSLLAELDRLRSASRQEGWQPIETAPENGTFLVFMPEERTRIQVAKWHPNVKTIGNSFAFDLSEPTHWRPLPNAPQQFQEAQGDRHGE